MHSICDMALNSAQEYCSNQYASCLYTQRKGEKERGKNVREVVRRGKYVKSNSTQYSSECKHTPV
jgi:hypothetical protein